MCHARPRAQWRFAAVAWAGLCLAACSAPEFKELPDTDAAAGGDASGLVDSAFPTGGGAGQSGSGGSGGNDAGGSGGSGGVGGEDCTNGADDNSNGLTDCADPLCAAATCVGPPPTNWSGPVWIAKAPTQAALPACPGAAPPAAEGGLGLPSSPPLVCADCWCSGAAGGTCQIQSAVANSGGNCKNGNNANYTAVAGKCTTLPKFGGALTDSFFTPVITISGESCGAGGGEVTSRPAPSFKEFARACTASTGSGCEAGGCLSNPPVGFDASVCIARPGKLACPAGYPNRTLLRSTKFTDTRDCGACSCGAASGGFCKGTIDIYFADNCTQPWGQRFLPYTLCHPSGTTNSYGSVFVKPGAKQPGKCTASQASQSGSVTAATVSTVCCT